jgi:nucleotide sugar dehydrogenase
MHVPGAGVGGHCLVKDPWLLKYGLSQHGKKSVDLKVIEASRFRNLNMPKHVISLLHECLQETNRTEFQKLKIAVLGVAFIENSDDPRNTPTEVIINLLKSDKFDYMTHDSLVRQTEVDFPISSDLNDVIRDSDAILVITAHQEYKKLDLEHVKSLMKKDPIMIDGRITFNPDQLIKLGFHYRSVGRGQYRS